MEKYLVDASVIHAWVNRSDKYHGVCEKFLKENGESQLHFPMHAYFEMYASVARRKKGKDFTGPEDDISLKSTVGHNIDEEFFEKCKKNNLFDLFKDLKASDLIYACFAKILDLSLVTCDSDFDICDSEIKIIRLKD